LKTCRRFKKYLQTDHWQYFLEAYRDLAANRSGLLSALELDEQEADSIAQARPELERGAPIIVDDIEKKGELLDAPNKAVSCLQCHRLVPKDAEKCPHCGADVYTARPGCIVWIIAVIFIIFFLWYYWPR